MIAGLPRKAPARLALNRLPWHSPWRVPLCVLLVLSALVLIPALPAHAAEGRAYGDVVVGPVVVGYGESAESVSTGVGDVKIYGEVDGDVTSAVGNVRVEGPVGGDIECGLGDVVVDRPVGGDIEAGMGDVYVNSRVDGDVEVSQGNLHLGEGAHVNDISVNGTLHEHPEAVVLGQRMSGMAAGFDSPDEDSGVLSFAAWLITSLALIGVSVLLAVLLPRPLHSSARSLDGSPGWSLLVGIISVPVVFIIAVVLIVSVIGWLPLVLIAPAYLAIVLFGAFVAAYSLGRRTLFAVRRYHGGDVWAAAVGTIMLAVVYPIPILGHLIVYALALLGTGAVILALLPGRRFRPTYTPYQDYAGSRHDA